MLNFVFCSIPLPPPVTNLPVELCASHQLIKRLPGPLSPTFLMLKKFVCIFWLFSDWSDPNQRSLHFYGGLVWCLFLSPPLIFLGDAPGTNTEPWNTIIHPPFWKLHISLDNSTNFNGDNGALKALQIELETCRPPPGKSAKNMWRLSKLEVI